MAHLSTPNVNFFPTEPLQMVNDDISLLRGWSMDGLNEVVEQSGYDAIQLHDVRLKHIRELKNATPERAAFLGHYVHSYHEGWRGSDMHSHENPQAPPQPGKSSFLKKLGNIVFFPPAEQTIAHLGGIREKIGSITNENAPVIVYPHPRGLASDDLDKARAFPGSRIQPTSDMRNLWFKTSTPLYGTDPAVRFAHEVDYREYKVAWDTFWANSKGKYSEEGLPWQEYLPALIGRGLLKELHLSLFRYDSAHLDPDHAKLSGEEGLALLGKGKTDFDKTSTGEVISYLRSVNWEGDVTVETPISGIALALGKNQSLKTREDLTKIHRDMTDAIKDKLPHLKPAA